MHDTVKLRTLGVNKSSVKGYVKGVASAADQAGSRVCQLQHC